MFCHGERVRATAAGLGSADRECFPGARIYVQKGLSGPVRIPFASHASTHARRTYYIHTYTARCLCARNTTMIFANDHKTVCY